MRQPPSMEVFKEFGFEAAHRLPNVPPDHKCARLHGHSFRVTVRVRGRVQEPVGWVIDFGDIKRVAQPIIDGLDHRYLNEVDGLSNPTSEALAEWLWLRLAPQLTGLAEIAVHETCTSGCTLRREDF